MYVPVSEQSSDSSDSSDSDIDLDDPVDASGVDNDSDSDNDSADEIDAIVDVAVAPNATGSKARTFKRYRVGLERSAAFAVEVRSAVWTAGPAVTQCCLHCRS